MKLISLNEWVERGKLLPGRRLLENSDEITPESLKDFITSPDLNNRMLAITMLGNCDKNHKFFSELNEFSKLLNRFSTSTSNGMLTPWLEGDIDDPSEILERILTNVALYDKKIYFFSDNDTALEKFIENNVRDGKFIYHFEYVKGNFNCSYNRLTSLVGCPRVINGNFDCSKNSLDNLVGGPEEVHGDYIVKTNITSFQGCAARIDGNFVINNTKVKNFVGGPAEVGGDVTGDYIYSLESLEGFPKKLGGYVRLYHTSIQNLKGLPSQDYPGLDFTYSSDLISLEGISGNVIGDFYCGYSGLQNFVGGPKKVGGDFYIAGTKLNSLEGFPKEVGGNVFSGDFRGEKQFTEEDIRAVCKVGGDISFGEDD